MLCPGEGDWKGREVVMTVVAFETLERRQLLDGLPHPNDPVLQNEHLAVMALVPDAAMTHTVVQSGAWSNPATWAGGAVPTADADVLIPVGLSATVDAVNA